MGKYRILIVDDEEALRYGLQTYLDMEGYDTDSVSSAEEALSLNLSEYDLILLDIMMSGMSGTDMAKIMKQNPVTLAGSMVHAVALRRLQIMNQPCQLRCRSGRSKLVLYHV